MGPPPTYTDESIAIAIQTLVKQGNYNITNLQRMLGCSHSLMRRRLRVELLRRLPDDVLLAVLASEPVRHLDVDLIDGVVRYVRQHGRFRWQNAADECGCNISVLHERLHALVFLLPHDVRHVVEMRLTYRRDCDCRCNGVSNAVQQQME